SSLGGDPGGSSSLSRPALARFRDQGGDAADDHQPEADGGEGGEYGHRPADPSHSQPEARRERKPEERAAAPGQYLREAIRLPHVLSWDPLHSSPDSALSPCIDAAGGAVVTCRLAPRCRHTQDRAAERRNREPREEADAPATAHSDPDR